jgi:hypothetical protein
MDIMLANEDRISELPDCLILKFLFPLPTTKEAIRTACLSKRWVHLWTLLPNFIFIISDNESRRDFFSFVDKTMTQSRLLNLNKFHLHASYDSSFQSLVNKWLRYVLDRNVKDVDISLWHDLNHVERGHQIVLDDSLFVNSSLTNLKLSCDFVNPTTGLFTWINLKSLSLSKKSDLDDHSLEIILSGTPRLETFELNDCYGFSRIDITSKSVKNFVISGRKRLVYSYVDLNAPYIFSLTVDGALTLCSLHLENVSSLVEAKFSYHVLEYDFFIPFVSEYEEQDALEIHITLLRHVNCHQLKLKLGKGCLEVLSRLEDEGFVVPPNIKVVDDEEFY